MPFKDRDETKTWKPNPCRSPEHTPPSMMVLPPGSHTWVCPACGKEITFFVNGSFLVVRS